MKQKRRWIRECSIVCAIAIAVLIALPIVALGIFLTRAVIFVGALGVVAVGIVAWASSPRFRDWLQFWSEPEVSYKGLRLATDVALAPGHIWSRIDGPELSVGVDDLTQAVLGPVETVDLPTIGYPVEKGDYLFRLSRSGRSLWARAPMDGEVVAVNEELAEDPSRINREPFGDGWIVRLQGEKVRRQRRKLLRGVKGREWFREEVDRMLQFVDPAPVWATLPDGGVAVEDLHRCIDEELWPEIARGFFTDVRTVEPVDGPE